MSQTLKIHHDVGEMVLIPRGKVDPARLKKMLRSTLDQYLAEDRVPVSLIHDEAQRRYGEDYRTPGYFLRLYRQRSGLTQAKLSDQTGIRQHHLSEMENNKRAIGKMNAQKLASILDFDYRKLL